VQVQAHWVPISSPIALKPKDGNRKKRDKFHEDRREALKSIMDWIDVIDGARARAEEQIRSPAAISGPLEKRKNWAADWPDLMKEIADADLRPSLRYLLPPGIYEGVDPIADGLRKLRLVNDDYNLEWKTIMRDGANAPEGVMSDEHRHEVRGLQDKQERQLHAIRQIATKYRERLLAE
jgi:hypothetical protein